VPCSRETELSAKSKDRLKRVVDAALKVGEVNRRLLNIQTLISDLGSVGSKIENSPTLFQANQEMHE